MTLQVIDLSRVLDLLPHMIWIGRVDGSTTYCNVAWRRYTGIDLPDTTAECWLDRVHADECEQVRALWLGSRNTDTPREIECRIRDRSGQYRWFAGSLALMDGTDANTDATMALQCVTFTDIHQRVTGELSLAEHAKVQRRMLDASVDCIKVIDPAGSLQHMNKSGCVALGIAEDERSFGMRWLPLLPKAVHQRGRTALRAARGGKTARFPGFSVAPDGASQHWDNLLTPIQNDAGQTASILCVSRDITAQRRVEERLRIASEIDDLTGLLNRKSFNARFKTALSKARNGRMLVGLLIADIDHFKQVNDSLGHTAGDHLLRVLGKRFKACVPAPGFVARLGGDEFAVVVPGISGEDDLITLANRVRQQIDMPIAYGGRLINGGMSVGCAIFPRDSADVSGLMSSADTALNALKRGVRGGVCVFDRTMKAAVRRKRTQLACARRIVSDGAVEPHYQPKVRLKDRTLIGLEALLRWRSPSTNTPQLPGKIAEAFNDYELAGQLADIMQRKVLGDIAGWLSQGLDPVPVSINAAWAEFLRDDFAERLLKRIEEFQVPTSLVEIEISDDTLSRRGSEFAIRALRLLRKAGLRISLDDFGTGYSSLKCIARYPIDLVKIDRSFVKGMIEETSTLAVVEAMTALGTGLELDVVAEGVELEEQRDILVRAGCNAGQGFLFGEPLRGDRIASLIG